MKVVILCGGQGTRLREETNVRPKPMVEIGTQPILWHIMKIYSSFGLNEFVLCLGYKGHIIKDYFVNFKLRTNDCTISLGSDSAIEIHQNLDLENWKVTLAETGENTQTGARIHRVRKYLNDETFCLTYGDGLGNIDVGKLTAFHRSHGKIGTVTGVRPPGRFGELEIVENQVKDFSEKPQVTKGLINGGFFVFEPIFIDKYLKDEENLTLESSPLRKLAEDGELMVFPHEGFWQPMDTFREWKMLESLWNEGNAPWKFW
jgi:glucose-1-phosphate cytidylyltransferase